MQARQLGGSSKRRLIEQHRNMMFGANIFCVLGVVSIMFNKVINKGAGLLFVGIFGDGVPRTPSLHAWIAIAWTTLMAWLTIQGLSIFDDYSKVDSASQKAMHRRSREIRNQHRISGAVAFAVGVSAACLGLVKMGDTGKWQAISLVALWALLWLPHWQTMGRDLRSLIHPRRAGKH
jgi:hypothetical protein